MPPAPSVPARVLHVMRMTGVSGAERHLVELARVLRAEGWASDALIPAPRPPVLHEFATDLARACDRVTVIRMPRHWSPSLTRRLAAAMASGRYAIAHAHLVHADWHLSAASVLAPGVPLISSKHNHDPFRMRPAFRLVEQLTARRYAAIIAISESLQAFTEQSAGQPATTVHYGLTAPKLPPDPDRRPGTGRLLAVGRLVPQKGFDVLLRALPAIRRQIPTATLAIAGEGSERAELERLVGELGLGEAVRLLGRREDVPELMREHDALVHPARWEGFGLVLLEAMREGLPIVASAVGAIPEVVEDGATGLLVAPDDAVALAGAVVALLLDPVRARDAGARGFARLKREFSPEQLGRGVAAVYARILDDRSSEGSRANGLGCRRPGLHRPRRAGATARA